MRTPTVEEFEAIAHSAAPGVFVPIGDAGMVTTRTDAQWIAWRMRQREADALPQSDFIRPGPGALFEAVAYKVRRNNRERREAWALRVCAGIDAAKRAPVTAAELRGRTR